MKTSLIRSFVWLSMAFMALPACADEHAQDKGVNRPLRVVTYNIKVGLGNDGVTDLARTAETLRALNPDLVGLQEVDEKASRSGGIDQPVELGRRLGMHHVFAPFMDYDGGRYGLAVLSRFPIRSSKVFEVPKGNEPRVALAVEVELPDGSIVTIVNLHFDWVRDDTFRFGQATALKKHLEGLNTPYLLLGDFNDVPGSRTLNLLSQGKLEAKKPADDHFTFSATNPRVEIDYIFASPPDRWSVESTKVIDEPLTSDHRPVLAELHLTKATDAAAANATSDANRIKPYIANPWYWQYKGEPILLVGGSDDDNLFQWPEQELMAQLDRLSSAGGNVIRNTMSDRKDKGFEVYPFKQLEDGKYDLNQWNDEYWNRFERMLKATAERQVFVQIEVWDRFDYSDSGDNERWKIHPYNPGNNINYDYEESGFEPRYPDHPGANKQPFFFTTPRQRNNSVVLPFQTRFVQKMLDHALAYDHVLYCIDNETSGEEEWARYWTDFIKQYAATKDVKVNVTEMWDDWNLAAERHKRTFDHPERYDFVDVSQNNHNNDQTHWDNFLHVRQYLAAKPRPMNTTKIYGATGNKFGHNDQDGIERFWRHLLAGGASVRFHRPDSGHGLNDQAVASIRAARKAESLVKLWDVTPRMELLRNRDEDEAYVAANPGAQYLLYFTDGGSVDLDLRQATGEVVVKWIEIATGEWGDQQQTNGGSWATINAPGPGGWIAVLLASQAQDAHQ